MGTTQASADLARDRDSNGDRSGWCCDRGGRRRGGENMDVSRNWFALYSIRKERNIPATAVAVAVGISSDRYIKIEKNELRRVKPEERAMISQFFNLPEEVLFQTNIEPMGFCSKCRTRTMPLDELEAMLAAEYGNKLKPNKKTPQGS